MPAKAARRKTCVRTGAEGERITLPLARKIVNKSRKNETSMRQGQNSKRSRGRGRKSPNTSNRSYESNGPDVKIRGTAAHICEKYQTLARDAQSAGDRVAAENYFQHAEHYYRLLMAAQNQQDTNQARTPAQLGYRPNGENDWDNEGDEGSEETGQQPAEASDNRNTGGEQPQGDEEAPRRRAPRRRRPRSEVAAREGEESGRTDAQPSNGHSDEQPASDPAGDTQPRSAMNGGANGADHEDGDRADTRDGDDREAAASA